MAELARTDKRVLGCLVVGALVLVATFMVYAATKGSHVLDAPASTGATAPAQPATSDAAAASPSVLVSDNPAFDLTGSGGACRMHYFETGGQTVTLFTLTAGGELITHVSGPDGIVRNDRQLTAGPSRFTYGFPLSQAIDMGAVLYLPDGSSQSCTISAGAGAP